MDISGCQESKQSPSNALRVKIPNGMRIVKKIPIECETEREIAMNKCLACGYKCDYGRAIATVFVKYKMKVEAENEWKSLVAEMDWR